jgi:Tetratricopeptide repeat
MTRPIAALVSLSLLIAAAPACAAAAASRSIDELVQCHLDALGGLDRIHAIRTLVYSQGTYHEGDYTGSGNAFMAFQRPYLRAVGDPEGGGTFREGYDGASWEWYGDPGVVLRTVGAAAGAIRRGAQFDGPLVDSTAKGIGLRLGETIEIADRPAVRVTATYPDGFSTDLFLDRESCLIVARRQTAPIHAFGAEVTSESRWQDYRPVGGVLFAHRYVETEIATGRELSSMQWGKIEANGDLPAAWFSAPEFERTPLQRFVEQLYYERTDSAAVMWTYREFRRFHPEVDTGSAVEFAGYQILKMGDVSTAIELLEQHAADHPNRADAAFGLGRAYDTAGETAQARAEYERALRLAPEHERAKRALARLN